MISVPEEPVCTSSYTSEDAIDERLASIECRVDPFKEFKTARANVQESFVQVEGA